MEIQKTPVGRTSGATIYSCTRKRLLDETDQSAEASTDSNDNTPAKRPRMNSEEMKTAIQTAIDAAFAAKEETTKQLITTTVQSTVQTSIESQFTNLKQNLKKEIKTELKAELSDEMAISYHMSLAAMIRETEKNLVVFGISTKQQPLVALDEIATKLELTPEQKDQAKVLRWQNMGRKKADATKWPIVFYFASQYHRNFYLDNSGKLTKDDGWRLDIDAPIPFRRCHSEMKAEAMALRDWHGVKTKIRFTHHSLVLKVKRGQEGAWTIEREFIPKPDAVRNSHFKGNTAEGGSVPAIITDEAREAARRTLRFVNFPVSNQSEVHAFLVQMMGQSIAKKLGPVSTRRHAVHIVIEDMQTANNIFQYFKTHKPIYEGNQVWCIKYGIA